MISPLKIAIIIIIFLCFVGGASATQISYNSMTSNVTNGYTANASSTETTLTAAYKAFDGVNASGGWLSRTSSTTPEWVQQSFPTALIATSYEIYPHGTAAYTPKDINFFGSNDFSTFTILDNQTDLTTGWSAGIGRVFTFSNTNVYKVYRLSINATNGGDQKIVYELYIHGVVTPVAAFTTNVTSGNAPLPVLLTDTSTNTPTSRSWGAKNLTPGNNTWFSLGTTTPLSTVLGAGNWSLNITATNAAGSNISTQVTWVNVSSGNLPPTIAFTTNITSGISPLSLYLNDTSTQSPTYWNTSWGDNSWTNQTSFPATNITHEYSTAGSYYINEYATNAYGTANGTPLLITVYGAAYSDFSAFNVAGNAPHTTYLYDTSTNKTPGAVTYYWDFGDGNTSTSENVYYTWNITGTYSVNHSMNNGLSTSWMNKSNYVTVGTAAIAPVASFYGGPQLGAPPLQVFFTDVSTNTPTSWDWAFGDGTTSTSQNPTKWYNSSGFFTVNLTATNTAGANTTSQSNFIMVY